MVGGGRVTAKKGVILDQNTIFLMLSVLPVALFGFTFCILVQVLYRWRCELYPLSQESVTGRQPKRVHFRASPPYSCWGSFPWVFVDSRRTVVERCCFNKQSGYWLRVATWWGKFGLSTSERIQLDAHGSRTLSWSEWPPELCLLALVYYFVAVISCSFPVH